jgi:hypothetical protein
MPLGRAMNGAPAAAPANCASRGAGPCKLPPRAARTGRLPAVPACDRGLGLQVAGTAAVRRVRGARLPARNRVPCVCPRVSRLGAQLR